MPLRRTLIRALFFPALAILLALPAAATSFVRVSDENMVDESSAIAIGSVVAVDDTVGVSGRVSPSTDYVFAVESMLKGDLPEARVTVRVLGGRAPHGMNLRISDAPAFRVGERAILFLEPDRAGTFHLKHFVQGAFHQAGPPAKALAVRGLAGAQEMKMTLSGPQVVEGEPDGPRDFAAFARWIRKRAAGERPAANYLLDPAAAGVRAILEKYTLFSGGDGNHVRWFAFDGGGSVSWLTHQTPQSGLADGGVSEASNGMAAWNADGATSINYVNSGTTAASAGFTAFDSVNAILWNDPNNEVDAFSCGSGGTLAIGGPWFGNGTTNFMGAPYHVISQGDVVVNNGLECFFAGANGVTNATAMLAHELGHSLGLDHSADSSALMYFSIQNGRGPGLGSDDTAAVGCIYAGNCGVASPPAAPSGLSASALSTSQIQLTWNDNANNETGYRVEYKPFGGSYSLLTTLSANATSTIASGLASATNYVFRVQATGSVSSAFSNEANATTQSGGGTIPNAPTTLFAAAISSSQVQLAWTDNSGDETGFRIEVRTTLGSYADVGGVAANSSSAQVSGLAPSTLYFFRVRASGTGGFSGYTNEANATTLANGGTTPTAPSGLQAATVSSTQVQLNWLDNSNNETGFRVELKAAGGSFADIGGAAANATSMLVTGLTPSTTYTFRVRASGSSAFSAYTNEATATTLSSNGGNCTPTTTSLCLDGGRFRVSVTWRQSGGQTGVGTPVPVLTTADSGVFWFFAPTNWEMAVKVLNGCGVNNRHWVFLGAATNQGFTLTVTDTARGVTKTYQNPVGSVSPIITDTDAFATCP